MRLFDANYLGYSSGRNVILFWLQPVIMLVGGAAVWRMGSLLRASAPQRPDDGDQRNALARRAA
jgi:hypothetical protein